MFFKFFVHDVRNGILGHKARFLVGFLAFFCLSSYHFLTLRIYELTNPEYFQSPVTTGDYILFLIGGCGKVEKLPGGGTTFLMPVMWMLFMLWILFASLHYPFADLGGIGKTMLCLSGQREIWWFSKCLWAVCNTLVNYLVILAASTLAGLCFGASVNVQANVYLFRELEMNQQTLTTQTTWNILPLLLLMVLVLVALVLLQMMLSAAAKPQLAYLLLVAYLFAGAYLQSPALLGNFAMPARSSLLTKTGLHPLTGVLLCLWIMAFSVLFGWVLFEHKDILGGEQA